MLFRQVWIGAWVLLVLICLVALWDVSEKTCQKHVPILLSRALTTDPWRGVIIVFNLLAVGSSFYLNSIVMLAGFLGFLCAFLVSMFQTNAHNALIIISTMCIMYECYPQYNERTWKIHWWSTSLVGVICSGWLLYSNFGCDTDYCAECSWWYISEYLFFWSMFLLVWWRIDPNEILHDQIQFVSNQIQFVSAATTDAVGGDKKKATRNTRIEF